MDDRQQILLALVTSKEGEQILMKGTGALLEHLQWLMFRGQR